MAMMAALAGKAGTGLSSLAGDLLGMKNSGDLFIDILRSRTVEDRLIGRFDLRRVYWDKYWLDARKDLAKNTSISEDRKSGVLTITVTDRDPQRAAQMARAYVEELDRLVAQVTTSSARRERIFIEQRLAAVKQGLDNASREFSEYASQNTAIDIAAQGKATVEAAARLEGELMPRPSPSSKVWSRSTPRTTCACVRCRPGLTSFAASSTRSEATPRNPTGGKPGSAQELPSIRQLPLLGVRWADLYRETKIQETVYEMLTQQYELAKIEEAKEIPVVKVLDIADVPEKKSFPPRLLIVALGAAFSVALGALVVVGSRVWGSIDPRSPQKQLLTEIWLHAKARIRSVRSPEFDPRPSAGKGNGTPRF